MLSSISSILTSSLEAGLLLILLIIGLNKVKLNKFTKILVSSVLAAIIASVLTVYVADFFGDREIFEGYLYLSASITAIVYWIWIFVKIKRQNSELIKTTKLRSFLLGSFIFVTSFLLIFSKVLEIVIFPDSVLQMSSSLINTELILKFAGIVLGLIVSTLFVFIFLKSQKQITNKMYLIFTTAVLLVVVLRQLIMVLQILFAIGVLPLTTWAVSILAPLINNYYPAFFYILIVFTTLLWSSIKSRIKKNPPNTEEAPNPAYKRKLLANYKRQGMWADNTGYLLVFIVAILVGNSVISNREVKLEPPTPLTAEDGKIQVKLDNVDDGNLYRFSYMTAAQTETRFIVIKKSSSLYGIALDACDICGNAGYYQDGKDVICKNCGVVMNIATIGLPGGCNPIPLTSTMDHHHITINASNLEEKQDVFK
ncbi:MAG: hypothetical protein K0S34_2201 [Bacillales bacterium]|jgi:uncharacterized membrane protein|nr:hypothetical protein [Bacillales bacterium]